MFSRISNMKILFILIIILVLVPLNVHAQSSPAGGNWNESDGDGDYADAPDSTSLDVGDISSENLTIEAWVYARSFPTGDERYIIATKEGAYELYFIEDGFGLKITQKTGDTDTSSKIGGWVRLNEWMHVAGVFNNTTNKIRLFIKGWAMSERDANTSDIVNSTGSFFVAGLPSGRYFDGRIDEVRVSDVVRYSGDFSPPGRFTPDENTRALWHWDEAVGAQEFADSSGNGNTLTGRGDDHALPVSLSKFMVKVEDNKAILQWRTETEVNNLGFHVWRGTDEQGPFTQITSILIPGAGTSGSTIDYQFIDEGVEAGRTYFYYLEDIDFTGKRSKSQIIKVVIPSGLPVQREFRLPKEFRLLQNYPNPFNPTTWIPYQLATDSPAIIRIYNDKGQLIRTIALGNKPAGVYTSKDKAAYWDGRNERGERVGSGVYFYHLRAGDFQATRRMLIVK